jgi:hypothetical protein
MKITSHFIYLKVTHDITLSQESQQVSQGQRRGRGKFASKDLQAEPQILGHSSLVPQTSCSSSQQ